MKVEEVNIVEIVKAIENNSDPKDTVVDFFAGSGSTLIACEKTDRICYTMEFEPHYVEKIIERWENLTGKRAQKVTK